MVRRTRAVEKEFSRVTSGWRLVSTLPVRVLHASGESCSSSSASARWQRIPRHASSSARLGGGGGGGGG